MNKSWSILFFIAFTFFLWNCASHGKLTGGDPDEQAPIMDTLKSTPNYQTNFYPDKIEIIFDEFIQLKNPSKEIGVSPPLKRIPKFLARGKTLSIEFPKDEVLREDATYTINFGNSIQDFRENNVLQNFTFVFSTGDVLDSLSIKGTVSNALDGQPIENAVVLLYDDLRDSVIYKDKPFYFDKTDNQGNFIIENIKHDSFVIYAITDENLSYTWDPFSEGIAFANEAFELTDSFNQPFKLVLSNPIQAPEVISIETRKDGLIKCNFTNKPDEMPEFSFSKEITHSSYLLNDSLFIWYDTISNPTFNMFMLNDTFKIKPKRKKGKGSFRIKFDEKASSNLVVPADTLSLEFNYPILSINKDSIVVKDTSNQALEFLLTQSADKRTLKVEPARKFEVPYSVSVKDSSLISYNGVYNDSLSFSFSYLKEEQLSILHLLRDSIVTDLSYVLILMEGEKELERHSLHPNDEKISIKQLIPKTYSLKIIEDKNKNGKWDPGDFSIRSQPERQALKDLGRLKENWELEIVISSDLFNNSKSDDTKSK